MVGGSWRAASEWAARCVPRCSLMWIRRRGSSARRSSDGCCPSVPVDSVSEGIEALNASRYGLNADVFTRDLSIAMRYLREPAAGSVLVNLPPLGQHAVRRGQGQWTRPRRRGLCDPEADGGTVGADTRMGVTRSLEWGWAWRFVNPESFQF